MENSFADHIKSLTVIIDLNQVFVFIQDDVVNVQEKTKRKIQRLLCIFHKNQPVSPVVKYMLSVREVWSSITGPVESAQCRLGTVARFVRSYVGQALSSGHKPTTRYTLRPEV